MDSSKLKIARARENNLKEISLEIPHDQLVVLTGISGSGKSSLAFDTVYAEGQRRYIETFSPYTRQFLDRVKHPNVDTVENVRPAIAIQQRTRILSSRSTVGSITNCNDYMKLLWAALAEPVCPRCEKPFDVWRAVPLAEKLVAESAERGTPLLVATRCSFEKKPFEGERERLIALGFSRFFRPSQLSVAPLEEATPADLLDGALVVVLDRVREGASGAATTKRVRESIEQAFSVSGGNATVIDAAARKPYREFSSVPRCLTCNITVAKARPALFSYNHPLGACPECKGFGKILEISPQRVVPNPMLSIADKAIQCWASDGTRAEFRKLLKFCEAQKISTTTPWIDLPATQREQIFSHRSREYRGVLPWFKGLERKLYKMHVRVFLAKYRSQVDCPCCKGARFKPDSLAYRIEGKSISEILQMPISELCDWTSQIERQASARQKLPRQLKDIFKATLARLQYLNDLGLSYLTLDRQSRTLSGGETQRVNLATALGSDLISTHFVLDEPSVGLHARDSARLMTAVRGLQSRGNSLLVVEHDPDFINAADHIVELGPKAGIHGGEITFNGPRATWKGLSTSIQLQKTPSLRGAKNPPRLKIKNATARNLKSLSVDIPLQQFVCLTGVSGSGKSSLVHEVIKRGYDHAKIGLPPDSKENLVSGFEHISQLLLVDQSPLAKSPRANIATYTGIWDEIRSRLASTDGAQSRALGKSAFSFNVAGGRCPSCDGAGFIREDMQFLSDVYIQCEVCLGRRFQETVLEVTYKGKNAHDFLQMSIEECREFFPEESSVASAALTLDRLGLGHLTLGHPLSELSGGEAQRLKLVPFIQQSGSKPSLLIFDEPTTGLHAQDVVRLIALLKMLQDRGHSVLCIEHNLALIASCDWIIDLGPEGGSGGGELVASGTPAEFVAGSLSQRSHTAQHLTRFMHDLKKGWSTPAKLRSTAPLAHRMLSIRGAREHNLKNIDVDIPLNQIVALTGVSGSGKSSIAKDIVYAEGQRRYLDCLSPYARQFIQELKRPEIDSISNVKPSICVYQHTFQPSRFSTVGTMSESYNYLRLLYAKVATQFCPDHPSERISPLSATEIAEAIASLTAKTARLLAPVIKMKKGNHRAVLERAVAAEFSQVRIDGVFLSPATLSFSGGLEKNKPHTIEFVIGKFSPQTAPTDLVRDAVSQALSLGGGNVIVHTDKGETLYSVERTCPSCKRGFFKPDPEDLSFHSRRGRCPECDGAGVAQNGKVCASCTGSRLNEIGRNLRLEGRNIHEASLLTAPELREFLSALTFSQREKVIAEPVLRELFSRLSTLTAVGLDYIPLHRDCSTLSGGELQRLRLATAMGSPLTGALYIFDEPSAGLHPNDNVLVLSQLQGLRDRGNSIIMIEHDADSIRASEHVIEVGPGGGRDGGTIVFSGPVQQLIEEAQTPTAKALRLTPEVATSPNTPSGRLTISNGQCNNVQNLSLELPLGNIVTFCGVSGAGKSSIVHGILNHSLADGTKHGNSWKHRGCTIESSCEITRVVEVDQKPIGANSRSTPISYLGIFDQVRNIFATSLEAKSRGWAAGFFSYNTGKGRCTECKGLGEITLEMNFLPDAAVLCESCGGNRFSDEANTVLYQGMTISDVLKLTFEEAKAKFANHRKILQPLRQACDLGLGYLTLGQSSSTLSGGESQRIKLVAELSASRSGHTVYILDEPTTGLHKSDVARLMKTLRELVERGNTVLLIEHDPDVLLHSDFLVEVGPGAGEHGGTVIFSGSPHDLLQGAASTPWQKLLQAVGEPRHTSNTEIGAP